MGSGGGGLSMQEQSQQPEPRLGWGRPPTRHWAVWHRGPPRQETSSHLLEMLNSRTMFLEALFWERNTKLSNSVREGVEENTSLWQHTVKFFWFKHLG